MADDEAFARQLQAQLESERLKGAQEARLQEEAALEAEFEQASQAVLERERAANKESDGAKQNVNSSKK